MVERRPAGDADEQFLRTLYASTRPVVAEWPAHVRAPFLAHQFEAQRTGWETMFPGSRHEVIVVDLHPVGRIWLDWSSERCLIVDLVFLPEHRRRGLGSAVVREVIAAADLAAVPVVGHVERANLSSLAFWTALGFRETAGDALFIEIERSAARSSSTA